MLFRTLAVMLLATIALSPAFAQIPESDCDGIECSKCSGNDTACDDGCDSCADRDRLCDKFDKFFGTKKPPAANRFDARRTPAMIGDFFSGSRTRLGGAIVTDQLMAFADDLDSPNPLPGANSVLTITEPGPVGIFDTSLNSVQEIQTLLRSGSPLPPAIVAGSIVDDATLTTTMTVSEIQALLASTPEAYDIISLTPPPGTYASAVATAFAARNALPGTTVYRSAGSGAMLQGGADTLTGSEDLDAFYFYDYQTSVNAWVPQVSGGGVGRLKLAEGGSVLPQDRVFFRYSYFDSVAYRSGGAGLSRFTPGFEKTFLSGQLSFELRAPFASSTVTDVQSNGVTTFGSADAQFGNLTMYLKALLYQSDAIAVSAGLGLEVPTADGVRVSLAGTPVLDVSNEDVHLQPFLGVMHYWNDRLFTQGFLQFDFAAGQNDVSFDFTGNGLTRAGSYSDQDNVFINYAVGYWLVQNQKQHGLSGVIPTLELHHTSSLGGGSSVNAGPLVFSSTGNTSLTNFVAGSTFEFGTNKQVSVAYAGALENDPLSNGAFRLMLSYLR